MQISRSCVKVEVAVLDSPSLTSLMVSVDVKHRDRRRHAHRTTVIIIIMYIYRAPINALSAHIIIINLNMIFCTHHSSGAV